MQVYFNNSFNTLCLSTVVTMDELHETATAPQFLSVYSPFIFISLFSVYSPFVCFILLFSVYLCVLKLSGNIE
jgi:hypothetical protein